MDYSYNRIIIIGNGYDLALKIPTSYNDFILWHLKEAVISAMNKPYNDDPLFKIKHTPYSNKDQIKTIFENCKEIGQFLDFFKRNFKFENTSIFFEQLIDQVLDKNWVDIENIYFNLLIRNLQSIQKSEPLNRNYEAIEELNTQLDFLKNQLVKYLIDVQTKYKVSSLDSPMGSLHDELNEKLLREQAYIMHKLHDTEIGNPNKIVFLNFNYTNYLAQFTFPKWKSNIIINIHGELNNPKNPIIFGYGDDTHPMYESLENEHNDIVLKQIKSFYYPKTNNYHSILGTISDKPYELFIVGHSCGLSDRTLLKTLFEHDNCLGIKIFHQGHEDEHFYKNISISRHFSDKAKLRDRILPFDQHAKIPQS